MRPATQNIGYFYAICYFADRFSFAHFLLDELCGVAIEKILGITASKSDPFRWISFEEGSRLIEQLKRFVRSAEGRVAKKVGDG